MTDEQLLPDLTVVFVHGLFAGPSVWNDMRQRFAAEDGLPGVATDAFEYDTRKFGRWKKSIPDLDVLADSLWTYLELHHAARGVALVGHSQGGLIITKMLAKRLSVDGGASLRRFRTIVQYGTPNFGSDYLLPARRVFFRQHPQDKNLRPLAPAVLDAVKVVQQRIAHPSAECHIPILAVVAASDGVVDPRSAAGFWLDVETVAGDHSSLLRADGGLQDSYLLLKRRLRAVLAGEQLGGAASPSAAGSPALWQHEVAHLDELLRLDDWSDWVGGLIRLPYRIRQSDLQHMVQIPRWLAARLLPDEPASLVAAFHNLRVILIDLYGELEDLLFYEASIGDDDAWLKMAQTYKGHGWNPRFHEEAEEWEARTNLVNDLVLELTRAVNWLGDEVRAHVDSGYRRKQGAVQIEGGPYESGDTLWFTPEYSALDRAVRPTPYVSLDAFRRDRYGRSPHTKPPEPDCSRCLDAVPDGETCPECGRH